MNALKWLGVAAMVVVANTSARAEDDKVDYAKLIVGKWEVTKADEASVPVGTLIEFTKDGKLKATIKKGDADENVEGTYKVVKNTFEVTLKMGDEEQDADDHHHQDQRQGDGDQGQGRQGRGTEEEEVTPPLTNSRRAPTSGARRVLLPHPRLRLDAEKVNTSCSLRELLSEERIAVVRLRHRNDKLERLFPSPDGRNGGGDAGRPVRPSTR